MSNNIFNDFRDAVPVDRYISVINPREVKNKDHIEITGGCSLCNYCSSKNGIITMHKDGSKFWCRKWCAGGTSVDALGLYLNIISCEQLKRRNTTPEQRKELYRAIIGEKNKGVF